MTMKKIRILIFTVLTLTVLLVGASLSASAETVGGSCGVDGDNVTWSYDSSALTLTISGEGEMSNYEDSSVIYGQYSTTAPWQIYKDMIVKVVIEEGVTNIGDSAFCGCDSLMSVTIPNSVTGIGDRAFSGCYSLTGITIPNTVTNIGAYAFEACNNLMSITIPDNVTNIENGMFYGCYNLTSITIPNGVVGIGAWAFEECSKLTSITIPDSVTSIGNGAFRGCYGLTSITIPDSVTTIGNEAFSWCDKLTSITIPNSVTTIGDGAFRGCYNLTSAILPTGITIVGAWFEDCDNLKTVRIPAEVIMIKGNAFANTSLEKIIYCGTEAQWNTIAKVTNWDLNTPAHTITYHRLSYTSQGDATHVITCAYCEYSDFADHIWNNGVVTTPPTHMADGVTTYTCTDCGATKTETIDNILAHDYGTWCYHDEDQHKKICECGSAVYLPHNWDNGKITKKPSHTTAGEKTYTCLDCGDETKQVIPIVEEHDYSKTTVHSETQHKLTCSYCDKFIIENCNGTGTGSTYSLTSSFHMIRCKCGKGNAGHHYSNDGDNNCDVCKFKITTTSSTETSEETTDKKYNDSLVIEHLNPTHKGTEKGCGSVISAGGGLILLASLGSVVLLRKKKKE